MSLRGRQWLDRWSHNLQSIRLRLPSPPYGNPQYWNITYKEYQHDPKSPSLQVEWGHVTLPQDLMQYEYHLLSDDSENDGDTNTTTATTWEETIQIDPRSKESNEDHNKMNKNKKSNAIMMLGCGYSKLGHDMMQYPGWKNMTQVDICSKVISDLTPNDDSDDDIVGTCDYIEDDANHLSAFQDNAMDAIIDKGLLDSLHLDTLNGSKQIPSIIDSVARVLKPNGIFLFFSLSQPHYLFPSVGEDNDAIRIVQDKADDDDDVWSSKQVRLLLSNNLLLYRYQKQSSKTKAKQQPLLKHKKWKKKQR